MIEQPRLEFPIHVAENECTEYDQRKTEQPLAASPDRSEGAARSLQGNSRQRTDEQHRNARPDAEDRHEEADLREVMPLTGECCGGYYAAAFSVANYPHSEPGAY